MTLLIAWIQALEPAAVPQRIGGGALAFMLISMSAVVALTAWCFWRILSNRRHFDPDGTGPQHSPVPGRVDEEEPGRKR